MDAIPTNCYVPALIAKQGERKALASLDTSIKADLTPILVAPPIDVDFETGVPKKSIDDHIGKLPMQIAEAWGTSPAFFDAQYIADDKLADGSHPFLKFVAEARRQGLTLTPIASPAQSADYLAAVASIISKDKDRDVGIRILAGDWPAVNGYSGLDSLMATLGVGPEQVHLVFDLAVETGSVATALATAEIRGLRDAKRWKSVVLLSTAIPDNMPAGKGLHEVERFDWRLYTSVRAALMASGNREPSFGDYAIAGASLAPEVDPRLLSISGTIRYTIDDRWLISKGGLYKGPGGRSMGGKAVVDAAAALQTDRRFLAPSHCDTEVWVGDVANELRSGGNPTVWREIGTRHHLTFVTNQIATTFEP